MIPLPKLPDALVSHFASKPSGVLDSVFREADDPRSPVAEELRGYLAEIPARAVAATCHDERFLFFHGGGANIERSARLWLAERALEIEVPRRRYALLTAEYGHSRPQPYRLAALCDLEVAEDHLVPLSEFDFDGSRLLRRRHAFLALATTPSPNSSYWLLHAIHTAGIANQTSVRLDPFLHGPAATFESMFYKMWIYGRPLDWDRIARLRAPEHGRWQPTSSRSHAGCTDFVWDPRGPEVHFVAEELPPLDSDTPAASRYAHAVFYPGERVVRHFDGAVRVYGREELHSRYAAHVRTAGKSGVREKVFRTDAALSTETFSSIVQAFFVWNEDIGAYFGATPPGD